jgi:hypothetical protein
MVGRIEWGAGAAALLLGLVGVAGELTASPPEPRARRRAEAGRLKVGDSAPEVELVALDGVTRFHLRERIGARPLVLVFGSYT